MKQGYADLVLSASFSSSVFRSSIGDGPQGDVYTEISLSNVTFIFRVLPGKLTTSQRQILGWHNFLPLYKHLFIMYLTIEYFPTLVFGPHLALVKFTSDSFLRDHSWRERGTILGYRELNTGLNLCKASTIFAIKSL